MGVNWDQLVEERNAWVAHNFPDPDGSRTPLDSVLGCIEECGEITHSHLKSVQKIRGDQEKHTAEGKDGVGDLTVYLLGVMSYYGVRPLDNSVDDVSEDPTSPDRELLLLASRVGLLARFHVYGNTSGWDDPHRLVTGVVYRARRYCITKDWDYDAIVQETWDKVKKRDWRKYPSTGLPEAGSEDNPIVVGSLSRSPKDAA